MANSDYKKFRQDAQPRSAVYSDDNSTINNWLEASKMPAANVTYNPNTGMSSTDAQAALDELSTEKMNLLGQNGVPAPTADNILTTDGNGQAQDSGRKFIDTITENPKNSNILSEKAVKDYVEARFASFSDYQGTFNYFAQATTIEAAKTAATEAATTHGASTGDTAIVAKTNTSLKPVEGDFQKGTYNGTTWTWTNLPLNTLTNGSWIYAINLTNEPIEGTTRYKSGKAILKIDGVNNFIFDTIVDSEVAPDNDTLAYNGLGALSVKNQNFAITEEANKFTSAAELTFKEFWQKVLNKINGLFQTATNLNNSKVSKAGDTMTGALQVEGKVTISDGSNGKVVLQQNGTNLQVYNEGAGATNPAVKIDESNNVTLKDGAQSSTKGVFLTASDKGASNGVVPLVNGVIPNQYFDVFVITYQPKELTNFNTLNSIGRWFIHSTVDVTANPPLNITGDWFVEVGSDGGNNLFVTATLSGTPGHRLFRTSSDGGSTWSDWQYPYALYNPGI